MKKYFFILFFFSLSSSLFAQKNKIEEGMKVYKQYCLACHQADGSGVPNMNPPLRKSDWVNGDKSRLIKVVLKGLNGEEIQVNGDDYSGVMASHEFLTNTQIANVLTYIRSNFENHSDEITEDEVKKLREKK